MVRDSKLKKRRFSISLITLIGVIQLVPSISIAATPNPKEAKAPCRLEVDGAHISKNTLKKVGKLAVKVVFKSICNLNQENLVIKVQIAKRGFLTAHPITPIIIRKYSFVKANHWVLIKDIYVYCKTTKSTVFYGTAEAQAYVNGTKVFAPRVQTKKPIPIDCGT